jgi:hypothetical protein
LSTESSETSQAVAPAAVRLSDQQQVLCTTALTRVQALQTKLIGAAKASATSLASGAATLAGLVVQIGDDPDLVAAIYEGARRKISSLAGHQLSKSDRADPMRLLAQLVLPGTLHKHRRTTVRAGARAVLEHMRSGGLTDHEIANDPAAHGRMVGWIEEQGGVTGIHNKARAQTRGAAPRPLSLTFRGEECQGLRDRLKAGQPTLVLLIGTSDERIQHVIQNVSGLINVTVPDGEAPSKFAKEFGGKIVDDGVGGQVVQVPAASKVLAAVVDGLLRFAGQPTAEMTQAA